MKCVDKDEWDLSGMRDRDRAERLLRSIVPDELIERVTQEATDDVLSAGAWWWWQTGGEMKGCSRAIFVIPLTPNTFDDLINGRCGYRAQYYRSALDGKRFNDLLVAALGNAAKQIFERDPKSPGWSVVEKSISVWGPQSKIGVHSEPEVYNAALADEFRPRNWAHRGHTVWLRAPRPPSPAIELKASWLRDADQSYQIDETKLTRHKNYHSDGNA